MIGSLPSDSRGGSRELPPRVPSAGVPGTRYQGDAPGKPVGSYWNESAVNDEARPDEESRGGLLQHALSGSSARGDFREPLTGTRYRVPKYRVLAVAVETRTSTPE